MLQKFPIVAEPFIVVEGAAFSTWCGYYASVVFTRATEISCYGSSTQNKPTSSVAYLRERSTTYILNHLLVNFLICFLILSSCSCGILQARAPGSEFDTYLPRVRSAASEETFHLLFTCSHSVRSSEDCLNKLHIVKQCTLKIRGSSLAVAGSSNPEPKSMKRQ